MAAPSLDLLEISSDLGATLASLPTGPGVGEIVGPDGRALLVGRPANLRGWVAKQLGSAPPKPGRKRPRLDLSTLAQAVRFATTTSAFQQRLLFERLLAPRIPLGARRDLRPPGFLRIDLDVRFPRVTVGEDHHCGVGTYGPFRNRRAAEKASAALHKLIPLRPCDFVFEPSEDSTLGRGCLFAQVRSCAAPCLLRVTEAAYREMAVRARALLSNPSDRPPTSNDWLPAHVGPVAGKAVVAVSGRDGVELYPVASGHVVDADAVHGPLAALEGLVQRLKWSPAELGIDDWPWLSAWLASAAGRGTWVRADEQGGTSALAEDIARALDRGV